MIAEIGTDPTRWPSQTEIAGHIGVTAARIAQALATDRTRWLKDPSVTALRQQILERLQTAGGIQTVPEITDTVLTLPTELETPAAQQVAASALARAAVEAEQGLESPRFRIHRKRTRTDHPQVLVVCSHENQRDDAIAERRLYAVVEEIMTETSHTYVNATDLEDIPKAVRHCLAYFAPGRFVECRGGQVRPASERILSSPNFDSNYRRNNPVKHLANHILHLPEVVRHVETSAFEL